MTQTPQQPALNGLDAIAAQIASFVSGVLSLDPQQATIRAGLTLLVVIAAALLIWGLRVLMKALTERVAPSEAGAAPPQPGRVRKWIMRIVRLAVAVAALVAVLRLWGVEVGDLLRGPLGVFLGAAGRIALILVIALAAVELTQLAIARVFSRLARRATTPRRAAQVRTLASLFGGVATTTFIVIAAMMALSEIGVEIGPLIAGAGIVGLAIGFGAQTLVKDFLTGIFLIIEDTVSIGDVARIGESSGLVEDMSLRTIKLRDFDGTLHVIPYGEAQTIHNMTKGFSFYVFNLSVSYSSDIGKALDLMKRVGEELAHEVEFRAMVLEPIEIFGVDQLADSGVVLKARIKTQPIQQWKVGREYLKRIKLAFDAAGVEIPFPHLKLVPPDQPIPAGGDPRQTAQ